MTPGWIWNFPGGKRLRPNGVAAGGKPGADVQGENTGRWELTSPAAHKLTKGKLTVSSDRPPGERHSIERTLSVVP